jgi:hypothetical protein
MVTVFRFQKPDLVFEAKTGLSCQNKAGTKQAQFCYSQNSRTKQKGKPFCSGNRGLQA